MTAYRVTTDRGHASEQSTVINAECTGYAIRNAVADGWTTPNTVSIDVAEVSTHMKDEIMEVLSEVYGYSDFNKGVNDDLADRIIDFYTNGRKYVWGTQIMTERDLINLIWTVHSGGTTAESAGKRIIEKTGMVFR